jgi:hypothetical protein
MLSEQGLSGPQLEKPNTTLRLKSKMDMQLGPIYCLFHTGPNMFFSRQLNTTSR